MSKYTTELRFLIESGYDIFDFDYEFYDPSKKKKFEEHFIKHFYFYEIGVKTPARFKHNLEVKFNELLPFYNRMFEACDIEYNPIENYNMTEQSKDESKTSNENRNSASNENITSNSSQSNNNITTSNDEENKFSDTPQNSISNINNYLTEHRKLTGNGSQTDNGSSSSNSKSNESYSNNSMSNSEGELNHELTRKGNIGVTTTQQMLEQEYNIQRKLRTLELQFFDECRDLFMLIY